MQSLYDMCDMLDDELKEIVKKGDISPTELDRAYKAVDIIKDIKTIEAMEDSKYSYDNYSNDYSNDYSNYSNRGSYEGGNSNDGRRGRDGDSDGRYSEDGSYRRGRDAMGRYTSRDGYSRHDDKEQMLKKIEQMKRQIEQM